MIGYRIEPADKNSSLFADLFNSYCVELTGFSSGAIDSDKLRDGLYDEGKFSFSTPYCHPYIIYDEIIPVGFVIYSDNCDKNDFGCTAYIDGVYILPPFRRNGIAREISESFINDNPGCGIFVFNDDETSMNFWNKYLKEHNISFEILNASEKKMLYKLKRK